MNDDLPPSLRLAERAHSSPFARAFGDYLVRFEMFQRITGRKEDMTFEALQNTQAWEAAGKERDELSEEERSALADQLGDDIYQAARVGGEMVATVLRSIGRDEEEFVDDPHAPDVVMIAGVAFWFQWVRAD
jgi:hypothetical protein